jgi:hypothetical protein
VDLLDLVQHEVKRDIEEHLLSSGLEFTILQPRYSSHDFVGNPNVLTWLLGRPPTTFEAYVRNQAHRAPSLMPDVRHPPQD